MNCISTHFHNFNFKCCQIFKDILGQDDILGWPNHYPAAVENFIQNTKPNLKLIMKENTLQFYSLVDKTEVKDLRLGENDHVWESL